LAKINLELMSPQPKTRPAGNNDQKKDNNN